MSRSSVFSLFSKSNKSVDIPNEIYGTVVARSRNPVFFTEFGFDDSVMGRFDVLALHVYLFARRMKLDGSESALALSQEVFDNFVNDIDRALRELGIGDTSVPKRKKKMVRSFYGLIDDLDEPIANEDMEALEKKVSDRFFASEGETGAVSKVANYIVKQDRMLSSQPFTTVASLEFTWPETDSVTN